MRDLVELYLSRGGAGEVPELEARARAATREMAREGTPISYVRSIFVPEDEICFHLFEAPSAEAVFEATRRAKLAVDRIVEAV
jgi:hypothetical protein